MEDKAKASPGWDALRIALPAASRAVLLSDLPLAARVYTYAEREGFVTLGDIAARSKAELLAARGMGRLSVRQLLSVVLAHVSASGATLEDSTLTVP
jgi:DNA-directed RNA polymerase alpha subunit